MAGSLLFSDYLLDGEPDEAGRQVSQLLWGYFLTPVTMAIVNLGIPGVLAGKALTAGEVAAAAGTDPGATARLLVVIEPVLPSVPEPAAGHMMDILMMVLVGGRERTREEHQALIEPTGYTFTREIPLTVGNTGRQPPWRILEFRLD